jgi:hypothetical protein
MKPLAGCCSAVFFLASTAHAEVYSATGMVDALRAHDPSRGADSDWFSLAKVDSLGTCKIADAGNVEFLLPDGKEGQRMFALALASETSGRPLTIWVDDTVTGPSGFCVVSDME